MDKICITTCARHMSTDSTKECVMLDLLVCIICRHFRASKELIKMEMLKEAYDSYEFSSEERNNETLQSQDEEMHLCTVKQVITYSQVDEAKIPTRGYCTGSVVFILQHIRESCSVVLLPGKTRTYRYPISYGGQIKQKPKMAPK